MFENVCGNAIAGGIDLAGLVPRYIDIRRGALLTFFAAWIIQPWQLINRAATFIAVLNSFSVFLAPIMGVMVCDYYFLRHQRLKLSHLFTPIASDYWFWHGVNLRVIPCWLAGWAPTIGGLIVSAQGKKDAPKAIYELYYIAFFIGFFISFTLFWMVNRIFPIPNPGEIDGADMYGTFTIEEARKLGVIPSSDVVEEAGGEYIESVGVEDTSGEKPDSKVKSWKRWLSTKEDEN